MCKHFSLYPLSDIENIREPLYALMGSALRESSIDGNNKHGTGIGNILKDGEMFIHKAGKTATIMTIQDEWMDAMDRLYLKHPVIGHVRRASSNIQVQKDWPDVDAHPFEVGDILLAHNGTIKNHDEIVQKHGLTKGAIDSYSIAELVSRLDALTVDNLNTVTKQLDGSYALVIQHRLDPTRILLCRHGRDLYYGNIDNRVGIIATSDAIARWSLQEVNQSAKAMWRRSVWDKYKFESLKADVWYEIIDNGMGMQEVGNLDKFIAPSPPATNRASNLLLPNASGTVYKGRVDQDALEAARALAAFSRILPISVAEFRYIYEEILDVPRSKKMQLTLIEALISWLKQEVLPSDNLRQHLADLLRMSIVKVQSKEYYNVERRIGE